MTTTLHHGDRSQAVRNLQKSLNREGAKLDLNAIYDDATEAAVRSYQTANSLAADGIAGPKTQASLSGFIDKNGLRHDDLVSAAERLDVSLASIYAINEVESAGEGFLVNGRPAILFERHIFHRQLCLVRDPADDAEALKMHADELAIVHPSIVNTQPGGYAGGTAEYQRLSLARLIDDTCALEATSWGAFQIMGFHWQRLGYPSVQVFATAMETNETLHLDAFVRFIATDPALHKALKAKKWADVARIYNGPNYQCNAYDAKLQRAYERHALVWDAEPA